MFYIVETVQQLSSLEIYKNKPCFIELIPFSDKVHPKLGQICAFYYRPLAANKGFILPINHLETMSLDFQAVLAFLGSLEAEIWTIDKKVALHYGLGDLPLKGLKMAYAMADTGDFPQIEDFDTFAHRFYQKKFRNKLDINRFIPIAKHYEKYEKLFGKLKFIDPPPGFDYYNGLVMEQFYKIEAGGIGLNKEVFQEYLSRKQLEYIDDFGIKDNVIHTEFNFYSITARPTCKFGGINFLNLKKEDNSRKFIIPKNDILVEMDYKSYQVRIMADLLGFKFEGNIHETLARQYKDLPTDAPVNESLYKQAKLLTFRYMYGKNDDCTDKIPFFNEIYKYRIKIWEEYKRDGYITSPISGRRLYKILEITQILPFLMQCMETERNAVIIEKLNEYLTNCKTKIVLYSYDAFLFDFSFDDGVDAIKNMQSIMTSGGYEITLKYGENYKELSSLDAPQSIFI